jgi:hypothetical protein
LIATATRTSSNIYVLSEIGNEKCCLGKEDESWLWHKRMGHIHFDNLVKVKRREAVREIPQITKPTNTLCKHCQQGKKTKTRFKSKEYSTTRALEIVHTDLVGPTTTKGLKGEKYFMLLVDDYTRMTAIFFLKNKSKAFENLKIYKEMVENEMDSKIKCLRFDNGGEFTSKEFMDYYSSGANLLLCKGCTTSRSRIFQYFEPKWHFGSPLGTFNDQNHRSFYETPPE